MRLIRHIRNGLVVVLLTACFAQASPKGGNTKKQASAKAKNPIRSLASLASKMETLLRDGISGKAQKASFVLYDRSGTLPKIRKILKGKPSYTITFFNMEFEPYLYRKGKPVYHIRGIVYPKQPPSFLSIRGSGASSWARAAPLAAYKPWPSIYNAAQQMASHLHGKSCLRLPLLRSVGPQHPVSIMGARANELLKQTPAQLAELCKKIPSLKYDDIRLKLDDAGYLIRVGNQRWGIKVSFRIGKKKMGVTLDWLRKS